MKKEQAEFGERLRRALRKAGMGEGATELADLVSRFGGEVVTPQAAHNWIRGKTIPRRQNLRALSKALKISPEQLYGDSPESGKRVGEGRLAWTANPRDQHVIDAFLALPPKRRELVGELIAALGQASAGRGG